MVFHCCSLVFMLLGCFGYMIRRVESNACRREILARQENLLRQIMAKADVACSQ